MTTAINADATRIIGQIQDGHAAMNAAGLGSPALDDFNNLLIEMISESDDPQGTLSRIVDLMEENKAAKGRR